MGNSKGAGKDKEEMRKKGDRRKMKTERNRQEGGSYKRKLQIPKWGGY